MGCAVVPILADLDRGSLAQTLSDKLALESWFQSTSFSYIRRIQFCAVHVRA